MFRLIVYNDMDQLRILYTKDFKKIKDIISYTNGFVNYNDTKKSKRTTKLYKTYKNLFQVIKV